MIVQSNGGNEQHLVLTMEQHTATAGTLAEHFGGSHNFARLEPADLVLEMVKEHDQGWVEVDASIPMDPSTGLPWSVYETPVVVSIETGPRSIDHNEKCHPYRGLLDSMHIVGLHMGRYGLNDQRGIDSITGESRILLKAMIENEYDRQDRLLNTLARDDQTVSWIKDEALMHNYKALQFFDSLALWLQVVHPSQRQSATFNHVPTFGSEDVSVTVTQLDEHTVQVEPYPFDTDPLEITIEGRCLSPQQDQDDLAEALANARPATQTVTLISDTSASTPHRNYPRTTLQNTHKAQ